jgi:hypothetical protein
MDNEANSHSKSAQHKGSSNMLIWIILIIVVGAGSFYGGVSYEKGHDTTTTASKTGSSNPRGGFGDSGRFGGGDHVFGEVTAISASSITIEDSRSGTSTTLAITSSTKITDNGQTASVSSIQTGTEVVVSENTSDTSQAASIMVNPSFGGGQPQQQGTSSTSTTTD